MHGGPEATEPVLGVVRVLVLVDHHVAEALAVFRPDVVVALEELHGAEQEVVEVHGVRLAEAALVELVHLGHPLVTLGVGGLGEGGR